MRDLKYVIFLLPSMEPRAIIFNGMFNHADIAKGVIKSTLWQVKSAGYCIISAVRGTSIISLRESFSIKVYGGSDSLMVNSLPGDKDHILRTLTRTNMI